MNAGLSTPLEIFCPLLPSKFQSVHLCCLALIIATPYLSVFLSILLRGFKEFRMQQPDQYLDHPDLSTSHHSSRTFTGCLSIGEPYKRLLHYVILHYLALALNICLTLLVFTPLLDPWCSSSDTHILSIPNVKLKSYDQHYFAYHGPTTWNSLSLTLRYQQEFDSFLFYFYIIAIYEC